MTYEELELELVKARQFSDRLFDILRKARPYLECCCEEDRMDDASAVLALVDEVLGC